MTHRFIAMGHRVIATGRRAQRLDALKAELGPQLFTAAFDIADANAIRTFVEGLPAVWRDIDVLVNNAGLALGLAPAWEAPLSDWDTMIETNIRGLVHMTRAILPRMVERDDGLIVNIGSTAGEYPYPGAHVYGASKAFVRQFSMNLRADLVGRNVRVSDVEPGLCGGSEFSEVRFGGDPDEAAAVYAGTQPLTPDDIAETVSWLISLPRHININRIEMMPTCQASAGLAVARRKAE
jgi:3-hydroxy acid dehydrogenase/malonic semialdehyde reductase